MDSLIVWLGNHFSPEQYLFWTRIQCAAWTAADVVIVLYLLRIANLARGMEGVRRHRVSYLVLAATLLPAPFVISAQQGMSIFLLEVLITVPHFALILYVLVADWLVCSQAFGRLLTATGGSAEDAG